MPWCKLDSSKRYVGPSSAVSAPTVHWASFAYLFSCYSSVSSPPPSKATPAVAIARQRQAPRTSASSKLLKQGHEPMECLADLAAIVMSQTFQLTGVAKHSAEYHTARTCSRSREKHGLTTLW